MPPDPVRPVRLFYDPTCGPSRFLASAAEGLSRGRLESVAFDGPDARVALEDLSEEMRFGAAHVVTADERRSGAEIVGPLVATTFGPRLGGLYRPVPHARAALALDLLASLGEPPPQLRVARARVTYRARSQAERIQALGAARDCVGARGASFRRSHWASP